MNCAKCLPLLLLLSSFTVFGQDITKAKPVTMSGSFSAYGETYHYSGDSSGGLKRPEATGRLQLNLNFSFFDMLTVPLTGILATDQVAFRQYLNQLAIHPKYKWITLHAGTFSPQFSDLTVGDASTLGGGFDCAPGLFHCSFAGGRINKGIGVNGDNAPVSYARDLYGGQVGYGDLEKNFVDVNVVESHDNHATLPDSVTLAPQQNFVTSLRFQLKLLQNRLTFANEISRSSCNRNTNLSSASSFFDWAMITRVNFARELWSTELKVYYIRPGYTSFGFSQLQADRFEYSLGGKCRLLDSKLLLSGSLGRRTNNLADDQAATTNRLVANVNATYNVAAFFGFDVQYAANTVDSKGTNDTSSVSNVNNLIAVVPRFMFSTGSAQHTVITSVSYNNSDNRTKGIISLVNVKTFNALLSYSLALESPLGFNFSTAYTRAGVDTTATANITITPTVDYAMFNGALTSSLGFQLGFVTQDNSRPDRELFPQLQINFTFAPRNTLAFSVTHRSYAYGGTPPPSTGNFGETVATLNYTRSF